MVTTQAITVRLPIDLYERLRREAYETRQPMNTIITEGLSLQMDPERYGQICALFEAAWHHAVPESLDDLPPMTSKEARRLAMLATEVMGL